MLIVGPCSSLLLSCCPYSFPTEFRRQLLSGMRLHRLCLSSSCMWKFSFSSTWTSVSGQFWTFFQRGSNCRNHSLLKSMECNNSRWKSKVSDGMLSFAYSQFLISCDFLGKWSSGLSIKPALIQRLLHFVDGLVKRPVFGALCSVSDVRLMWEFLRTCGYSLLWQNACQLLC